VERSGVEGLRMALLLILHHSALEACISSNSISATVHIHLCYHVLLQRCALDVGSLAVNHASVEAPSAIGEDAWYLRIG
jgi:hypothetical protein